MHTDMIRTGQLRICHCFSHCTIHKDLRHILSRTHRIYKQPYSTFVWDNSYVFCVERQRAPSPSSARRYDSRYHANRMASSGSALSMMASTRSRALSPAVRDTLGSGSNASSSIVRGLSDRMGSMDMSASKTVPKARQTQSIGKTLSSASSCGVKEHAIQKKASAELMSRIDLRAEFSDLLDCKKPLDSGSQTDSRSVSVSRPGSMSPDDSSTQAGSELGPGTGTSGLWNLGNTCYQNSTLQVLAGIPELVNFFHSSQVEDKCLSISNVSKRGTLQFFAAVICFISKFSLI